MRAIFNVGKNKAQGASYHSFLKHKNLTRHVNALHLTSAPRLLSARLRLSIYVASDRKFYGNSLFFRFTLDL